MTDSDGEVRHDAAAKPGVTNLLDILGAASGRDPRCLVDDYSQYGPLKADAAAAVIEMLRPIRERRAELLGDRGELSRLLGVGAERARAVSAQTLDRVHRAIGLLQI